ncbi:MAG TPA: DUF1801 domain-containing protein [Candidatus Aquilonibacter sp.]|nr:DUF1801 domain-containing protein [Candidatus Aquilonibacter sp.]
MRAMAFENVDAYIAAQPPVAADALTAVRNIIRTAVPNAVETIAYDMPTYLIDGKRFMHFAAWTNHLSLYAINSRVRAAFESELRDCHIEGSTIRFSYGEPLPEDLIRRLVVFRAGLGQTTS